MIEASDYFDTPQRTERQQLLMHLVANAEEIPYLRAPQGAGKTRFARELAARLGDDYSVVWLVAGASLSLREQLTHELDLPVADSNWLAEAIERHPDCPLLLIVDDAERLQLAEIADLLDLAQAGARALLVGTGELAQAKGNWDLQFVDLPPFTESETRAFLGAKGRLEPGEAGARTAAALHRASEGLPGLLLDALDTLPVELPEPSSPSMPPRRPPWGLVAAGVAVIVLAGLTLYFQDTINAWFEPTPVATAPPVESPPPAGPSVPAAHESVPEPPVFKSQVVAAPEAGAAHEEGPATSVAQAAGPVAVSPGPVEAAPGGPVEAAAALADDSAAEAPDPVLDAIIDEAIKAAAQPPPSAAPAAPAAQPTVASTQANPVEPVPAAESVEVPPSPPQANPVSEAAPAEKPVARRAAEAAPRIEKAAPKPSGTRPAKAKVRTQAAGGLAWLRAQPDSAYTLQLVGARDRQSIRRFVRRHGLKQPHAIFERELNGKPWYSLVAGTYPDRQAAVAARARLPQSVAKAGVWPRTFGSIRQQMKANN